MEEGGGVFYLGGDVVPLFEVLDIEVFKLLVFRNLKIFNINKGKLYNLVFCTIKFRFYSSKILRNLVNFFISGDVYIIIIKRIRKSALLMRKNDRKKVFGIIFFCSIEYLRWL